MNSVKKDLRDLRKIAHSNPSLVMRGAAIFYALDIKEKVLGKDISPSTELFAKTLGKKCQPFVDFLIELEQKREKFVIDNNCYFRGLVFPFKGFVSHKANLEQNTFSSEEALQIVRKFLFATDRRLYTAFSKCLLEGRLLVKGKNLGETELLPNGKSYIFVKDYNSVLGMSCLVHEFAHYYYDSMISLDYLASISPEERIKSELPALTLELIFINYMQNQYPSKETREVMRHYEERFINAINGPYCYNNIKYALGFIYAKQIVNDYKKGLNISITDLFRYIAENSFSKIYQDIRINYQELINELQNNLSFGYQKSL